MKALEHWVNASSISTTMPSRGTLPLWTLGARSTASSVSHARPFTRKVSVTPGRKNSKPTWGLARMFLKASARRLPGRSGMRSVRMSRIRTKPEGSPRGVTSQFPLTSEVARHTNGDRSMNWRVRSLSAPTTLARTRGSGSPIISRSSTSVVSLPIPVRLRSSGGGVWEGIDATLRVATRPSARWLRGTFVHRTRIAG